MKTAIELMAYVAELLEPFDRFTPVHRNALASRLRAIDASTLNTKVAGYEINPARRFVA